MSSNNASHADSPKKLGGSKSRILVIDDEVMVHQVIEAVLESEAYTIITAISSKDGMRLANSELPDVILLDVMLPSIDGYEVCKQLRQSPATCRIPIVMISALSDRASRILGLQAGADDFLTKPIDSIELRIRVKNLVQLNRFRLLHEQDDLISCMLEEFPDGMVICAPNGFMVYANPTARKWLSLAPDKEISGLSLPELRNSRFKCKASPKDRLNEFFCTLEKWYQPENAQHPEQILNVRWSPRSLQGKDVIFGFIYDSTEHHSLNRMSLIFQNLASHKLRTPLNALSGALEILSIEQPDLDKNEWFRVASQSTSNLIDLSDSLLRHVNPNLRQNFSGSFPVGSFAALIERLAHQLAMTKNPITVIHFRDDRLALPVNEAGLEVVFLSFLSNSVRFHPETNPQVEVHLGCSRNQRIEIKMMDDGIRLSNRQLELLGTPFYQAEKHFTGNISGWGLNLALAIEIIESLDGTLSFYNRDDTPGFVICVDLPALETNQ